jgi:spermidine/putrescine transport system permease protein
LTAADLPRGNAGRLAAFVRFGRRHDGWRGYLLLAPALCLMLATLLLPLISVAIMSTWSVSGYELVKVPSFANYVEMVSQPMYRVLLWRSLTVATLATLITVALCYPMAYYVAFHVHRHKSLWLIVMILPFWTSYLLRVFAWKVILGYEGLLNSALLGLGLVDEPVAALLYSKTAVTFVLAHSWAAFVILPIYVSLEKIDRTYLETAADLGDGPLRRFWRITLPLSLPGIVAAFFMMFVPTLCDYITPAMVGGPDGMMIGNLIQAMEGPMHNHPAGAALTVVMILTIGLSGLAFLAVSRLVRR